MKSYGFTVTEKMISNVQKQLRAYESFKHSDVVKLLIDVGVPEKLDKKLVAYSIASKILKTLKKEELIIKHIDSTGGYWVWKKD